MQRMLQFAGRGLRAGPVPSAARSTSHAQVVRGFRSSAWVGKGIDDFLEKPAEDGSKVTCIPLAPILRPPTAPCSPFF